MSNQLPQKQTILDVQHDLERLGANCRVSVKRQFRGKWERIRDGLETFEAALALASKEVESAVEVGIFLDHEEYGGVLIWTSKWPEVVNRFEHLSKGPDQE